MLQAVASIMALGWGPAKAERNRAHGRAGGKGSTKRGSLLSFPGGTPADGAAPPVHTGILPEWVPAPASELWGEGSS